MWTSLIPLTPSNIRSCVAECLDKKEIAVSSGTDSRSLARAMSIVKNKTRITANQVAEIIGCSKKSVYNKGAGTEDLTRRRNGTRQVRFILEEVVAFAEKQEKNGKPKL